MRENRNHPQREQGRSGSHRGSLHQRRHGLEKGKHVQLIGFGAFKQVQRAARTGLNPSAGEKLTIVAAKLPEFVPGSAFKAAVDPKAAKPIEGRDGEVALQLAEALDDHDDVQNVYVDFEVADTGEE